MSVLVDLTGNTIKAEDTAVLIPAYEYATQPGLTATSANFTLYVNPNVGGTYQIAGASVVFGTAGTGNVQIEVATGTQATGSGTNQLTAGMSLTGTANTTVNGTVIASPTTIAAGSRVNVIFSATPTGLANGVVTVLLKRIS